MEVFYIRANSKDSANSFFNNEYQSFELAIKVFKENIEKIQI